LKITTIKNQTTRNKKALRAIALRPMLKWTGYPKSVVHPALPKHPFSDLALLGSPSDAVPQKKSHRKQGFYLIF